MDDPTLLSWIERGQLIAALLVAIGVAGEFVLGFMAGPARHRVDQAKDAEMSRLVDSSRTLEKHVADAKAEMSKQQTRAATAEKELLDLKERIKPRRLSDQQCTDFVKTLKTSPNEVVDFGYTSAGGDETFNFARQLLPLFEEAGWTVRNEASISNRLDIQVIGVGILSSVLAGQNPAMPPSGYIKLTPTLTALQAAFRSVGIEVQFISWFPGKTAPEVVIGSKPEPKP